jgi:hypothetical protein
LNATRNEIDTAVQVISNHNTKTASTRVPRTYPEEDDRNNVANPPLLMHHGPLPAIFCAKGVNCLPHCVIEKPDAEDTATNADTVEG